MNVYCEQHLLPVIKISKRPVIIDDVKGNAPKCDFHACPHEARFKLRFYKNPPLSQGAAIV